MRKIAIINQRYGSQVNGGSETYTMQLAEHLKDSYEVEVLTTCALEYSTWENDFPAGTEVHNGVRIRRFPVKTKRNRLLLKLTGVLITRLGMNLKLLNHLWIRAQGPCVPELLKYLEHHRDTYDVFIFVTYLYYPAVYGLQVVGDRSIFVPTAHEEPYIHFRLMEDVFASPAACVFLTEEEKELVCSLFPVEHRPCRVAAMGISSGFLPDPENFREKYGISGTYFIYAGRIDMDKG